MDRKFRFDLVAVFTNNFGTSDPIAPENLLRNFIVPSVKSDVPLPANIKGVEMLNSMVEQTAQTEDKTEPVLPLPEIAQQVSGQTYYLESNPNGYKAISLTFHDDTLAVISRTQNLDEIYVDPADPIDWSQAKTRVGLDNVYRFSPGPYSIYLGIKGHWISEDTFVVLTDYTGNTRRDRIQFTFLGDQVTIEIRTEGVVGVTSMTGKLKEREMCRILISTLTRK